MILMYCKCGWHTDKFIDNCEKCGRVLYYHVPSLTGASR